MVNSESRTSAFAERTPAAAQAEREKQEQAYAAESAWRRDQAHANVYARDAAKKEITRLLVEENTRRAVAARERVLARMRRFSTR
jgi:hypothetical protein